MDEAKKQEIITKLRDKEAMLPCPRCGNQSFALLDGYFKQFLQEKLTGGMAIGGPTVPSVITVCQKCGFMAQHALGALDLLPSETKEGVE